MYIHFLNEYVLYAAIAGLVFGLGIMWVISRHRLNTVSQLLEDRINELKARLQQHEEADYRARIAELQTLLESERQSNREKIALLEQAEKNMSAAFENLANRIIEEKSKKFTEQNRLNI